MKLSKEELQVFSTAAAHNRELPKLVERWRVQELEDLPFAGPNFQIQQGRVQALTELSRLLAKP